MENESSITNYVDDVPFICKKNATFYILSPNSGREHSRHISLNIMNAVPNKAPKEI
jgi:hypothetical protein